MQIRKTTAGVAVHERADYWRQVLREVFLADCRVEPCGPAEFHAGMSLDRVGAVELIDIRGAGFNILRQNCADPARKFALLQLYGSCLVREGARVFQLDPGDLCLLPDGEAMGIERPGTFRHIAISVPATAFAETGRQDEFFRSTKMETRTGAAAVFAGAIRQLLADRESIEASSRQVLGESITGLLKAALTAQAQGAQVCREAPSAVAQGLAAFHKKSVRRYIRDNLSNPTLNVDFIAKGVGLSPRYIHRLFAGEGSTLMEWVWIQRLECAARDLADGASSRRPIGSIAYAWGFNDQAHFSRSFRKHFNVPPRDYREAGRRAKA